MTEYEYVGLYTENEAERLQHSKITASIQKYENCAQGQGQMSKISITVTQDIVTYFYIISQHQYLAM